MTLSDDIIIRLAEASDFETVYSFVNALEERVFHKSTQQDIYIQNIGQPDYLYLLAELDEKIVGYLSCHSQNLLHHGGRVGEIQEMYVLPDFRQMKIGSSLLKELKNLAKAKRIIQIEVTSGIARSRAHSFYEREGFRLTSKKYV